MAIYTKKGDTGQTSLYDPTGAQRLRLDKDALIVEVLGAIDELNSYIGVAKSALQNKSDRKILLDIQENLLTIGSTIAGSNLRFSKIQTSKLERFIDKWEGELPVLKNFVMPGGSSGSAHLQYCRSLTRRAERRIVALNKQQKIKPQILSYMNRLSDFFFVFARRVNYDLKITDDVWISKKKGNT